MTAGLYRQCMGTDSQYEASFKCGGRNPAAIPSTRCGPPIPVLYAGDVVGCIAAIRARRPDAFSARDTPTNIPAVPTPPQNAANSMPACSTSSRPIPLLEVIYVVFAMNEIFIGRLS